MAISKLLLSLFTSKLGGLIIIGYHISSSKELSRVFISEYTMRIVHFVLLTTVEII